MRIIGLLPVPNGDAVANGESGDARRDGAFPSPFDALFPRSLGRSPDRLPEAVDQSTYYPFGNCGLAGPVLRRHSKGCSEHPLLGVHLQVNQSTSAGSTLAKATGYVRFCRPGGTVSLTRPERMAAGRDCPAAYDRSRVRRLKRERHARAGRRNCFRTTPVTPGHALLVGTDRTIVKVQSDVVSKRFFMDTRPSSRCANALSDTATVFFNTLCIGQAVRRVCYSTTTSFCW
jgi:hypothetical protein